MNSHREENLDMELNSLLEELHEHHRSRDAIFIAAVVQRLDKSLASYDSDLMESVEYLARRKPDRLMRKLVK